MTAPTTAKKAQAPKATNETASDKVVVEEVKSEETKSRIPTLLEANPILADFCKQYLNVFDKISKYNEEVLAEKDSQWNGTKVMEKARELARPTDKNAKPVDEIKVLVEAFEEAINNMNRARKAVLDRTSKELGITLSATSERNPEIEAPLKEDRKLAITIGTQLQTMADMLSDPKATEAIVSFLSEYPMPAIGRDQVRTFGSDGKGTTPKYRVKVDVFRGDEKVISEDGFTKTALALPKFYERGQAIKADKLREAWEAAGNSATNVVSPVEFTDNGLKFVITKK